MLNSVEWMDETTRLQALDKAKAITSHIGFPKQLLNDSQIAKIYENVSQEKTNPLLYTRELSLN